MSMELRLDAGLSPQRLGFIPRACPCGISGGQTDAWN